MNTDYKSVLYFHCPREGFPFCEQYGGVILHNIDGAAVFNTKKLCPYMATSMTHWTNVALCDGGFRKHNLGPDKEILIQLCQGYENPSTIIIVAKKHNATIGCPICCGIFASIAAHAAEEEKQQGKKNITPYWRTLKEGGVINPKYPGGVESQKKLLEREGHKVIQKGKNCVVADFEKFLVK